MRHRSLRAASSGTTVSRSRPWRNRSNGPEQPHARHLLRTGQGHHVTGEHRPRLAVDLHVLEVLGPPRGHLPHRGVDVRRDLLRGRRAEQVQHRPHRVEVLRHPGGRPAPPGDPAQHRRRGAGLELQTGAQQRQPERLLVGVGRVAHPAEPEVRRVEARAQLAGEVALGGRGGDDLAHLGGDHVEGVEHRDARLAQRLGGVEDPLGRVGLAPRRDRGRDPRRLAASVDVRRPAQRPGEDQVVLVGAGAAQVQRQPGAVRTGVLHPQVEDGRVGAGGRAVELLGPHAVAEDVVPGDLHEGHCAAPYGARGRSGCAIRRRPGINCAT